MEVKNIGVIGAGKMGHGIALTAALAGYKVILHDRTNDILTLARKSMEKQVERLAAKNCITVEDGVAAIGRVQAVTDLRKLSDADLIIESIFESLEAKTGLWEQLDKVCKSEALFASNTSSFSITTLAAATQRPAQFVGMHFFLPPIIMNLVEVIRGYYTCDETVNQIKVVVRQLGKNSVEVKKDTPGFIANRIYTPLFLEAFKVYEEGIASKEDIDMTMKLAYGLPIGPFALADLIGLDILKAGLDYFHSELGAAWKPPLAMKQLVQAGRLGKKTGKGWYDY
jgi:3-hydroxybutyryl-CoA dehydrogenase